MPGANGNAADYFVDRHLSGPARAKPAYPAPNPPILNPAPAAALSPIKISRRNRTGWQPFTSAMACGRRIARRCSSSIRSSFRSFFGEASKPGIVPVPLNTLLSAELYKATLLDCRARALFVSSELLPMVEPVLAGNPYLQAVFVIEQPSKRNGSSLLGRWLESRQQKERTHFLFRC